MQAFLMQSFETAGEKDILKFCPWDFLYSVINKKGKRLKCQDFCTLTTWPYPGTDQLLQYVKEPDVCELTDRQS